ncbi:MAG: hypothetical protein ACK522_00625 [Synechococcaceae cyanobacterium]|jgi:hypothetical protein
MNEPHAPRPSRRRPALLAPWLEPWPWVSLGLLILCSRTEPPRLWFWLALLLISLVVGLVRSLARRP